MTIDFSKLNLAKWLAKIPAALRRTDAKITQAQEKDAPPRPREVARIDFMEPPVMRMPPLEPMTHYDAARFGWKIFGADGRARGAINKNASKSTQSNANRRPFEIDVQLDSDREKQQVWESIHNLFGQLNIYRRARRFAIAGMNEGESFYRVIFTEEKTIAGFKKLPGPRSGFEFFGPSNNPDDRGAYIQVEKATGRIVNVFYNIEIVPFLWEYDEEIERGTPLAIASKRSFDKVSENEDHLSIARRSRSFKRLKRKLSASSPKEFIDQVNELEQIRRNQGSDEPFSDVYYNQDGDVSTLDESSPSLWNINDVKHQEGVLFDALQTPRALYAAGGKDIPNRSVMDVLYDEWITSTIAAVEDMLTGDADPLGMNGEGLLKLIELQLNIIGRTSRFTPVGLIWPSKSRVTDDEVSALKEGYASGHVSNTTFLAKLLAIDWETEQEIMLREQNFMLEKEIEIAKLRAERDKLIQKDGTTEPANNPNEAGDTENEGENTDDAKDAVEELLSRSRNGHGNRIYGMIK